MYLRTAENAPGVVSVFGGPAGTGVFPLVHDPAKLRF